MYSRATLARTLARGGVSPPPSPSQYTNRELRERLAVSDAHSRAVIAALHDGEWIARAAGAARGGGAEALRAELHGVLLPRREGAGAAGPALPTAMRVPVVAAGGGSAVAAGAVAAAAGAGKAAAAEPVAGAAGAGSGSAAGAAASEGTAAGAPAPAAPTPAAAAPGKARPFI
jgi:hypothetical protein